jgi:hypothetical protein
LSNQVTVTSVGMIVNRRANTITIEMAPRDFNKLWNAGIRLVGTKITFEYAEPEEAEALAVAQAAWQLPLPEGPADPNLADR